VERSQRHRHKRTRQRRSALASLKRVQSELDKSHAIKVFRYDGPHIKRQMRGSNLLYYYAVVVGLILYAYLLRAALPGGAALAIVAGLAFLALPWAPARVRVGSDGLELRWLWSRTLVHFSDIASLIPRPGVLELAHSKGRPSIYVHVSASVFGKAEFDQLYLHLNVAWQQANLARTYTDVEAILDTFDGNPATLEKLRSLTSVGAAYREVYADAESLIMLALDPHAAPAVRVKSAVAALASDANEARCRLKIAADTCVDEDLSAALQGDEAAALRVMRRSDS
jgi:hypothetical protein